jgi:hypothetical protein
MSGYWARAIVRLSLKPYDRRCWQLGLIWEIGGYSSILRRSNLIPRSGHHSSFLETD